MGYGNGRFVAVGFDVWDTSGPVIETSTDGSTWVFQAAPGAGGLSRVAYGGGYFAAVGEEPQYGVGYGQVRGSLTVLTSADGVTWAQRPVSGMQMSLKAIAYGNGHFVAVGLGGTILQSGSIITLAITPNAATGHLTLSLSGPIGPGYTIQSSTDLISWQNVTTIITGQSTNVVLDAPPASDHVFYRAYSQ